MATLTARSASSSTAKCYGGAYLLRRGLFMPWELPALFGPDVARAGWREFEAMLALEGRIGGIHSARLRVSALEMG